MRKNLMFGLIASILLIATASIIIVNALPKNTESPNNEPAQTQQPEQPMQQTSTAGVYTSYSASDVSKTQGTKILFFHASWCPQCRALDKSITEGSIPAGVTIFKVDYDTNQALRQQYGVTIQTTLVRIDDSGKLVTKYVAYEHPTLQALIDNLL